VCWVPVANLESTNFTGGFPETSGNLPPYAPPYAPASELERERFVKGSHLQGN